MYIIGKSIIKYNDFKNGTVDSVLSTSIDKTIYESKTEAEMSRVELVRDEIKNLIKNKEFSYVVSDKDNTAYIFVMGTNQRIAKISIDEIDENEETYKDYKRV